MKWLFLAKLGSALHRSFINLPYKPMPATLLLSSIRRFFGIFCLRAVSPFRCSHRAIIILKGGRQGGPRGVDRSKTNYGRVTCTVIYDCRLFPSGTPIAPQCSSSIYTARSFFANSTRGTPCR